MNHLKHRIVAGLAVAAMLTGGATFTGASPVSAQSSEICPENDSGKIDTTGDPATVTYTAPDGQLVAGYCVKAGTTTETKSFDPPVKTVVIDHSEVDSVSHYSVILVDVPTTTTTPTTEAPTTTVEDDTPTTTVEGDTPTTIDGDTPTEPVDGETPVVPGQEEPTDVVEGDGGDVPAPGDTGNNPDGGDDGTIPTEGVTETPAAPAPTGNTPVVAGDGGPAPTGSPTGTLPNTGAETNAIMAIGALLLALGGAAFAVARRRNPLTAA